MGVVRRRTAEGWEGVEAVSYGDSGVAGPGSHGDSAGAGVRKHELIGARDGAQGYELRHFTVPPGGRTARERHAHDHGVMIVTGRARVTLGEESHEVGPGDVVYVAGDELHCFETVGDEPLGFVCVVPANRARDRRGPVA